jgi:hypothetical protein
MGKISALPVLVAVYAAFSASAFADDMKYEVRVRGFVPVICNLQSSTTMTAAAARVDLGIITEFCNSGRGYQVWADHSPNVEGAVLLVDGVAKPLSPTGSTLVSASAMPGRRVRHLMIDLHNSRQPLAVISMRIVPL